MAIQNEHCCERLAEFVDDESMPVLYVPKFREYGIRRSDGGTSYQILNFCPWCGETLPLSLRDKWFEKLDSLGLEPEDDKVPTSMKSDSWWKREKI